MRAPRPVLMTLALSVLATAALAACATGDSTSPPAGSSSPSADSASASASAPELAGTSWQLTSYAKDGAQVTATTDRAGTLVFGTDGRLSGSTGCNRFTGTYTQTGSALTLGPVASTMMACPGALGDQETAVLAALPEVAGFTTESDGLQLTAQSGAVLLTYAPAQTSLAGTSWQATGINNGKDAVVSSPQTEAVTAEFGTDGTVSGTGGCNTYSGPFTVSGKDGLKIGPVAATAMACEDDAAMVVEQQYFTALEAVTTFTMEGQTLTLRDDSGATQVVYARTSQ